jgi:hypothetical protein
MRTKLGADPKQTKQTGERQERQLTLDLLLLRLEGRTRGLSRQLQVKDRSILLPTSLALILVGHTQLGQLPVEPRDFLVPELEGRLCLLKRSTLLLELALRVLSCHAFALEGVLGLLKGGPLLLELSFHLLVCAPLLLELALHRGERGNLVR